MTVPASGSVLTNAGTELTQIWQKSLSGRSLDSCTTFSSPGTRQDQEVYTQAEKPYIPPSQSPSFLCHCTIQLCFRYDENLIVKNFRGVPQILRICNFFSP